MSRPSIGSCRRCDKKGLCPNPAFLAAVDVSKPILRTVLAIPLLALRLNGTSSDQFRGDRDRRFASTGEKGPRRARGLWSRTGYRLKGRCMPDRRRLAAAIRARQVRPRETQAGQLVTVT